MMNGLGKGLRRRAGCGIVYGCLGRAGNRDAGKMPVDLQLGNLPWRAVEGRFRRSLCP